MKKQFNYLLVLLIAFVTLTSCSNDDDIKKTDDIDFKDVSLRKLQATLYGEWKRVKISGGIAGTTTETNGPNIMFNNNNVSITSLESQGKTQTAKIEWEKSETIYGGEYYFCVAKELNTIRPFVPLSIKNDTLYVGDNIFDGYMSSLVKLKD